MPSEKAKMLAGELYDADDPELTADHRRARERTDRYNDTSPDETERRRRMLDELFGSVGDDVTIKPPFRCDYGYNIHVGDEFFANYGCVVLDVCRVDVGDHCMFGPGVDLYTATHPVDPDARRTGLESGAPISIGDDVWIGGQAVVNLGVTIGDGVVVGSGAVVTDDVPDGVVVQGNPAEVVGTVD